MDTDFYHLCQTSNTLQIWASLTAYVNQPSHAADRSNRVARLINGVARITGNVAEATKKNEGALNHEVYTTLLEAARKATPQTSSKRKVTTEEASKSKKRKEAQDIQQYIPQGLSEENATLSSVEEGVAQLSRASPTTSRSTKRPPTSMYLSPCTGGKEWQATWAAIVKKQPINKVTNKPFVWLDNLTKVLVFMWGSPQGVNFVMRMVEAVYRDFDNLTLDAITSVGSPRSSVHTLEMRYKRVLALSTAPALQSTELLCEYKRMADDFIWLEQQTQDPSTELGKEWAKREIDPKKETTDQARSNVVMQEVFKSMHPEEMAKDEREAEIAKLRKIREYARNIATMIAIFGWGVVPLLACAP